MSNSSSVNNQNKKPLQEEDDVIMEPPSKKQTTLLNFMNNHFNSTNISELKKNPTQQDVDMSKNIFLQRECTQFNCTCNDSFNRIYGCKFYGEHSFQNGKPFPNNYDPYNNSESDESSSESEDEPVSKTKKTTKRVSNSRK
jgi:hypothetical protein